jgi:hypothetical protein
MPSHLDYVMLPSCGHPQTYTGGFMTLVLSIYIWPLDEAPPHNFGVPREWTSILGVCTHIREIAIGTNSLWSCIDLGHKKEWVDLCIPRARQSVIDAEKTNLTTRLLGGRWTILPIACSPQSADGRLHRTSASRHRRVLSAQVFIPQIDHDGWT